jgi:N-alpha-acetyltransferase 38, NatC auxiliary subunit
VPDGRVFDGTFACMDKQKNIILINTDEYAAGNEILSGTNSRFVGMVMIPWRWIVKVEADLGFDGLYT